jgi:hypothetical protein
VLIETVAWVYRAGCSISCHVMLTQKLKCMFACSGTTHNETLRQHGRMSHHEWLCCKHKQTHEFLFHHHMASPSGKHVYLLLSCLSLSCCCCSGTVPLQDGWQWSKLPVGTAGHTQLGRDMHTRLLLAQHPCRVFMACCGTAVCCLACRMAGSGASCLLMLPRLAP